MKKILIIEDEQDLREAMQARLMSDGYHVRSTRTSEEGLQMVLDDKPDLILLDIMTGSIHGAVFAQRVRILPEGQNDSKIIVVTNLDNDISREKFAPFQIEDFLVKAEVTLDDIAKKAADVLGEN